jgi:hypothetical protein
MGETWKMAPFFLGGPAQAENEASSMRKPIKDTSFIIRGLLGTGVILVQSRSSV